MVWVDYDSEYELIDDMEHAEASAVGTTAGDVGHTVSCTANSLKEMFDEGKGLLGVPIAEVVPCDTEAKREEVERQIQAIVAYLAKVRKAITQHSAQLKDLDLDLLYVKETLGEKHTAMWMSYLEHAEGPIAAYNWFNDVRGGWNGCSRRSVNLRWIDLQPGFADGFDAEHCDRAASVAEWAAEEARTKERLRIIDKVLKPIIRGIYNRGRDARFAGPVGGKLDPAISDKDEQSSRIPSRNQTTFHGRDTRDSYKPTVTSKLATCGDGTTTQQIESINVCNNAVASDLPFDSQSPTGAISGTSLGSRSATTEV